ncbi:MAG: pyridoxine 5'-phosphate synthase [Candidatus Omnitrophica bacterium]|nr:pyridoxine 5'-phosphate synthase [Candidatus Omnitrophota bacterium]
MIKLGVNLDHVATLRQARGGHVPSPARAVLEAEKGGADGITLHLREDRRHIQDSDLWEIKKICRVPINLEMALHPGIIRIALRFRPEKVCVVPEKRQEVTTEGGLDAIKNERALKKIIPGFKKNKIEVSLFIDPSFKQIEAAKRTGAQAIEIHTGAYADARGGKHPKELVKIAKAARYAHSLGLIVNAGHGLNYENVHAICCIPEIYELNIGHSIISRAVFTGLRAAVREMKRLIKK